MNSQIERVLEEQDDDAVSDSVLLERFVDRRDDRAFAEIVSRYGGLVLGVCRRGLADEQSAEDAFQATFLVLARRAGSIRARQSLGGWLYAVAYRIAARTGVKHHRLRAVSLPEDMIATDDALFEVSSRHQQRMLDDGLNELPEKYRQPLVLRYLLGKSNRQVAEELNLSVTAVEGRLKRGKKKLRLLLVRRGVSLTIALATLQSMQTTADAAATSPLVHQTVQAAIAFRVGGSPAAASRGAKHLAEKELTAMSSSYLPWAAAGLLATVGLVAVGAEIGQNSNAVTGSQQPATRQFAAAQDAVRPNPEPIAIDANGAAAPLPPKKELLSQLQTLQTFQVKQRRPAEEKIAATLSNDTSIEFIETPLEEVVVFLQDLHAIPIFIDKRALEDTGLSTDEPITLSLKSVSLRSALRLMLHDLDLDYVIKNEVLSITSHEVAESTMETVVYSLHHLDHDAEAVVRLIENTIQPDSWKTKAEQNKGPRGAIEAVDGGVVVTHNQRTQAEIMNLLSQLQRQKSVMKEFTELKDQLKRYK